MAERGNPTGYPQFQNGRGPLQQRCGPGAEPKGQGDEQYKNIETKVNNREYFGDEYETGQEDEMSSNDAKTEKAIRPGRA